MVGGAITLHVKEIPQVCYSISSFEQNGFICTRLEQMVPGSGGIVTGCRFPLQVSAETFCVQQLEAQNSHRFLPE